MSHWFNINECQINYQSETTNNIGGSYSGLQQGVNTLPMQVGTAGIDAEDQCPAEAQTSTIIIRGCAHCLITESGYEIELCNKWKMYR